MRLRKRLVAVLAPVAAVTMLAGLAPAASAQELPGSATVHNATQISFNDETPQFFCTVAAVGNDKYGRKIGVTAGHCVSTADHPLDEVNIAENDYPIYDRNNLNWKEGGNERGNDPIAHLRWFKDADGASGGHGGKDYAIIEFVDGVNLSQQGPHVKMTGIHELPSGTIASPYATAPAQPREKVLGTGIFTNHQLITSSYQTGVWYGRITGNTAGGPAGLPGPIGVYQANARFQAGDSGGPAVIKDASAQYPSSANGGQTAGKWVGIVRGLVVSNPPYSYTSSANILADLRTRDLASGQNGTVAGAGFEVTLNP